MTGTQLIRKLIACKEIKISSFNIDELENSIHLYIQPHKNGSQCHICERRGTIVTNAYRKDRVWRDLPLGDWEVFFHYCPKEIVCPTHGRSQEMIPWAAPYQQVTYRFEYNLLLYARSMTLKACAGLLKISTSTTSDILHRCINRAREGHKIKDLTSLGIDEIAYKKGRKYATIVYDLVRSKVVWIGEGKGKDTADKFFKDILGTEKCKLITLASCDMGQAYISSIGDHCKNAQLVLDRFHIAKSMNDAVDEVRKEVWRALKNDQKKAIKGLRWILYRHSNTRTKSQSRILNLLEKNNNKIYRAWVLKDEFEQLWEYKSKVWAEKFLKKWITKALRSRIAPIQKFAKTMRRHLDKITAFSITRLTNAVAEGLNRIIKLVKNRASGFSSLKVYTDMIYLTVGDVDIPAQIPSAFHTGLNVA